MTTLSRRQTRHRTFGWYTSDPVAHNRTVAIAKQMRSARRAIRPLGKAFATIGVAAQTAAAQTMAVAVALMATDFRNAVAFEELATEATALGMPPNDARTAINDHRNTHPETTWEQTREHILNLALNNALINRSIDQ